jgi:hypothetical protein
MVGKHSLSVKKLVLVVSVLFMVTYFIVVGVIPSRFYNRQVT